VTTFAFIAPSNIEYEKGDALCGVELAAEYVNVEGIDQDVLILVINKYSRLVLNGTDTFHEAPPNNPQTGTEDPI
jgi:hypothetical protein